MAEKRVSVRGNDVFKHKKGLKKDQEISPQAKVILDIIETAGELTRSELIEKLAKELTTKQPAERVLSYYKKPLVDEGFITVTLAKAEPKPKAEKKAKPAPKKAAPPKKSPKKAAAAPTETADQAA